MKKKDIIKLVNKIIKENTFYGNREQPSQLSTGTKVSVPTDEYPFSRKPKRTATGMMEGDALIDSGIEAYKKILKISPNNSLKGAYARELRGILGSDDINDYEFENIKVDDEGNPIDLSSEQAIALTRVTKNVRVPLTVKNNPEMYDIEEYGGATLTSAETELAQIVTDKGKVINIPVSGPEELTQLKNMKNIKNASIPKESIEENPMFTNDVGRENYIDDEGRYAKSQMHKMAHYAEKLSNMLHDMEQLPAWVQAKITKASDYMSMVYHYLEYEFARKGDNLMEHVDKYNKRANLMEGAMQKFFEMFDKGKTDEEIVQDYAQRGTTVPEAFVSKARKQYEGLKKMKLELEISEKEFRNSSEKMVNNAEEGMEPTEEKKLASGIFNEEPNEGNAFAVARLKAIKSGEKSFKLGDKEFDVTDVSNDDKKAAEKV